MFALTILFCALAAAVVTLAAPSLAGFARWLLIAESIGLTSVAIGISSVACRRYGVSACGCAPHHRRNRGAVRLRHRLELRLHVARRAAADPAAGAAADHRVGRDRTRGHVLVYVDAMRHRIQTKRPRASRPSGSQPSPSSAAARAARAAHALQHAREPALVGRVDPKLAQSMIDQIIVYLRATLAASREESVTLRQEFTQLSAYLEIMALRMGHRISTGSSCRRSSKIRRPPDAVAAARRERDQARYRAEGRELEARGPSGSRNGAVVVSVTDTGRRPASRRRRAWRIWRRARARPPACLLRAGVAADVDGNAPEGTRAVVRIER